TNVSVNIMNQITKPIHIIAVMEPRSSLKMAVRDIKKTQAIVGFASHPNRGKTIAVIYGKSTSKFFMSMANHLLPNANFIVTTHLDIAYRTLEKHHHDTNEIERKYPAP
ncbi:MAG: hypothetical protein AAFQ52_15985, partial [Chloroflexota bacterium]